LASFPRVQAYHILLAAEKETSRGIDEILGQKLQSPHLTRQDKGWIMELVYGTTRMKLQLDTMIAEAFKGRYSKAQHGVKTLLRMGTFQLKHMHTRTHAAVHETVQLSKQVGLAQASGLINAVLRKVQKVDLEKLLEGLPTETRRLAVGSSHPDWLIERWMERYAVQEVGELCAYNNTSPATWVRRNILLVETGSFESFLMEAGVNFTRSSVLDVFYRLDSGAGLVDTAAFQTGWFSFQDLAAGIVASLLEVEAGDIIVDTCAAPGGKMAYLAELSGGNALITACDASQTRLQRVHENIQRLQLQNVQVLTLNAAKETVPQADKMLLDVPCSGTGVLGRRADARWKRQPADLESLSRIQRDILLNSWTSLNPGGLLVYATCTLEPEENWDMIDSLIEHLPGAGVESIMNPNLNPYIDERGAFSTLPWRDDMDGMFAVKIRKSL